MKIHVRTNIDDKWLRNKGELPFSIPFIDESKYETLNREYVDPIDYGMFDVLRETGRDFLENVSIDECDYVVYPHKWDNRDSEAEEIIKEAKSHGKKVLFFFNSDDTHKLEIEEDEGYIFRTSFTRSDRLSNEYSLPPFVVDPYLNKDVPVLDSEKASVGFCGGVTHTARYIALDNLHRSNIKTNFIIRKGFWAPGMTKKDARDEMRKNIEENIFTVCARGAGNFSYRLMEVMCMGRIPIIIDSDCVLPFGDIVNWSEHSIIVPVSELNDIANIVESYYEWNKENLQEIQRQNRKIWLEYLSPQGFVKNAHRLLELQNV